MTHIVVDPRRTISFEEFCTWYGPAVALDGYVEGAPRIHADKATFDHHGDLCRTSLPATCEQVLDAILGTHPVVSPEVGIVVNELDVYVNDCDPDVAFAVWALEHPEALESANVIDLFRLEGYIDTHAGMCVGANPAALETLCWITAPWAERYHELPILGRSEMVDVIDEIGERLEGFAAGYSAAADMGAAASFDLLTEADGIWVIRETHPLGRCIAAAAGAQIVIVDRAGPSADTRTISVCGDTSVDLRSTWDTLNAVEELNDATDRWGGCDTVGGSPRAAGTRLDHATIIAAVADARR